MKSKWKFAAIAAGILLASSVGIASNETVSAKSYSKAVTKIAGIGNYAIYHRVTKNGPSGKFTSTKYLRMAKFNLRNTFLPRKATSGIFTSMGVMSAGLVKISLQEIRFL